MSDLTFSIAGAEPALHAASPTIRFALKISDDGEQIEALVLRSQIRIEPQWRSYTDAEKLLLRDLFGTTDRWNKTLHALAWADVPVMVPAFSGETQVNVHVPCTYDFDVEGGNIPLRFLFSGSVFRAGANAFSAERISWSSECAYRMAYEVWRDAMRACYGDSALIRIDRETFEYLQRLRAETGATSWDEVIRHPAISSGLRRV
jgi:hypothetical protein